ncbi:MAG: tRNA (adenosine(37)-N6)-threonylcarbamoyltransferase complex ATPase subunit type 1 TsaE [Actinomycetes bacterium]
MSGATRIISSVIAMEDLGFLLGSKLSAGVVVLLSGELGSGKTALTRGIGRSLGIKNVTSPTFVISKIYPGRIPLVHVDAYRLIGQELAVFDDLDLELRIPQSVTVIEWGSGFVERLSDTFIEIDIEFGNSPDERVVTIKGIEL